MAVPLWAHPQILRLFRITGLTKVFGIYETVDQAIAAKRGAQERIRTLTDVISPLSRPAIASQRSVVTSIAARSRRDQNGGWPSARRRAW